VGFLAAALAVVCLALGIRVYSLERNLKEAAAALKARRVTGDAAPLRLAAPNRATEALLAEITGLLRDMETQRGDFRRRETALREQISNVSHDLRTPLTSILGYLQLLEEDKLTPDERREYLSVIRGRAVTLQSLITSFYDLTRLEGDGCPLCWERVDLAEVLGGLLAAFYEELEGSFAVTVDLAESLPVMGDRAAFTRIYTNLLRNALDHGSGQLTLTGRREEGRVVTALTNGGASLAPEDVPHIFDRFFTGDRTRSHGNAGLGMAIVGALVSRMKGQVSVAVDQGDFTVTIQWNQA